MLDLQSARGAARRLNQSVVGRIVASIATIECMWAFLVWSLIPVAWPASQGFVFYVSGGVLQLVLLPAILWWQDRIGAKSEERAAEDHSSILEILAASHSQGGLMSAALMDLVSAQEQVLKVLAEAREERELMSSLLAEVRGTVGGAAGACEALAAAKELALKK
jgi:hypothetical protein